VHRRIPRSRLSALVALLILAVAAQRALWAAAEEAAAPEAAGAAPAVEADGAAPEAPITVAESGANQEPPLQPGPAEMPVKLTLHDAFLFALRANKDILVTQLDRDAAEARIMGAEGEFDATLFGGVSHGRTHTPIAGVPLGETDTSDADYLMGVRKRMVTGTDVEVSAGTTYMRDRTGTAVLNPQYAPDLVVGISQDILKDFGVDINRTEIDIASNNLVVARESVRQSLIANLLEVEATYWALYFALADLDVRQQQFARAQELVRVAEVRERAGEGTPIDITRAQASAALQSVQILTARNQVDLLRNRLLRAMGIMDPSLVPVEFVPADTPPEAAYDTTVDEAAAVAREFRPEVRQADLAIDNSELAERLARNQRLPSLKLFGQYGVTGLGDDLGNGIDSARDDGFNSWAVGLAFEWPFPNRTARADYQVATIERRVAGLRKESVIERVEREVADTLDVLRTSWGRIETARESLQFSDRLLKAEDRSFNLGRSDSTDVLNAQAALADAQRDEVRARTDYAVALAALLAAQGNFLEARGIVVVPPEEE
jgi:outer membrane protein